MLYCINYRNNTKFVQQASRAETKQTSTIVFLSMNTAEVIGIKRHCMGTDGEGITTLVAFHGCLLRCKYCLNPQCQSSFDPNREMSPKDLMDILQKDELYFIATGGGVTFGGGEPLLHSRFIADVLSLGAKKWHTTIETSLCVDQHHVERLLPWIDEYIVDVKDMNDNIYQNYTGHHSDRMKSNLRYLIDMGRADSILCRLPIIPGYNTERERTKSEDELIDMGITRFEKFTYIRRKNSSDSYSEVSQGKKTLTLEDVRRIKEEKKKMNRFLKSFHDKYKNCWTKGLIVEEDE